MDADDLLQSYSRTGEESTFTRFVESCSGMVYGIAQRQLGDPSAAEEVAQNVFLLAAKKSKSLAARRGIVAWLQRSTVLEVKNRRRSEAARRRKLERFARHEEVDVQREVADQRDRLALLADIALSRLSSQDRQVVLLRYYEDRTYGEISEITGKEEPALRKQLSRALKRMEQWCRKECPRASTTALVTALSLMGRDRAPAALATTISTHLGTGSTVGMSGTLSYVSVFSTVAIVSLVAVPLLAWQQQHLGQLYPESVVETPVEQADPSSSLIAITETDKDLRELRPLPKEVAAKDPGGFAKALLHAHGLAMNVRGETEDEPLMATYMHDLSGILLAQASLLDSAQLLRVIDEVAQLRGLARSKNEIAGSLIEILGRRDPEAALALAHRDRRSEVMKEVLLEWCERDVNAAAEWIGDLKASDTWLPWELEVQIQSSLCQALVAVDPEQSVSLALPYLENEVTGEFRRQLTRQLAYHREHGAFLSLAKNHAVSEEGFEELLVDYVEDAFGRISVELTDQAPREGIRRLFAHPSFPQEYRNRALIAAVTEPNMDVLSFTFPTVVELSPPELVEPNLRIVMNHLVRGRRLLGEESWYDLEILAPYREELLAAAAKGIAERDADQAAAWINQIHDEALRGELSESLVP